MAADEQLAERVRAALGAPGATATEDGLGAWVTRGVDFAETLPPK